MIVDTDVWSEAFRKRGEKSAYVDELRKLLEEGRVQMIGIIRMEILCGIRAKQEFDRVQQRLRAFSDRDLDSEVFITAARFFNLCRSKGIQGSSNDFILCACSMLWKLPILSKDKDFLRYRKLIPIELAKPRNG
ncbi:MAG: type II toxin-antitoxin system VapC family toxin [Verrucomicrobiia bacterium]